MRNATLVKVGLVGFGGVLGAALTAYWSRSVIQSLEIDPAFNILTRQAAERRMTKIRGACDVIFFDLDGLHMLNGMVGYDEADRLIRTALHLRHDDVLLPPSRYYSGDEFLLIVAPGAGSVVAERIRLQLAQVGLSATISIAPSQNLALAIKTAKDAVQEMKRERDSLAAQAENCYTEDV